MLLALHDRGQLGVGNRPRSRPLLDAPLQRVVGLAERLGARGAPALVAVEQDVDPDEQTARRGKDERPERSRPPHGPRVISHPHLHETKLLGLHALQCGPHAVHHGLLFDRRSRLERPIALALEPQAPQQIDVAGHLRAKQLDFTLLAGVIRGELGDCVELLRQRRLGLIEWPEKAPIIGQQEPARAGFGIHAAREHALDASEHLFGVHEPAVGVFGAVERARREQHDADEHNDDGRESRAQET